MRALVCCFVALTFPLTAPSAAAQDPEGMMLRMEAAQAEAQAQAVRPGDEELGCEALQEEITTTMQDPALQAQMVATGAWAQGQVDEMNAARGSMRAQMGMSLFMGIASSFIPGAGYAQMAQQRAMAAGQQARAEEHIAGMMAMSEGMMTIMPQMMRGQRMYDLAQAKQCPFLQGPPPQ